jgi:NADPH-dependent curcumin reductase CurA
MPVSREIHLVARPTGLPREDQFTVVEVAVGDAADGEVLVQNLYMSVDPVMRFQLNGMAPLNETLRGAAIGRIVQSKSPAFAVGDIVSHYLGFREYFRSDGEGLTRVSTPEGLPLTVHLNALGMTGFTAYGGLLRIGQLKPGEQVFVSAAAGAVGSVASQVARLKGCRVIGSTGSPEKAAWLRDVARLDAAINYRETRIGEAVRDAAPEGLDVYFDNVGGDHLEAALACMNLLGRIPVCGMISGYNGADVAVRTLSAIVQRRVMLRGFNLMDFQDLREPFEREMTGWLRSGDLRSEETVLQGIGQAPAALIGLFEGRNLGKMLVRLG